MLFKFLEKKKESMRAWAVRHAEGPHAKFWLGFVAFTEASFFPLPPLALLVPILLASRVHKWVYYALFTTFFSVLGGIFGYVIGLVFFDALGTQVISFYGLQEEFNTVSNSFDKHAFITIFTAAFTPIPYKIFTIAAGVFKINIITFTAASIFGRVARYFIVSYITKLYGKHVLVLLDKYFAPMSVFIVILLAVFIYLFV